MCDAGHPKPVLCDKLEGSGGVGVGGSRCRGHLYTCGQFLLLLGKNHNIVIILQLK